MIDVGTRGAIAKRITGQKPVAHILDMLMGAYQSWPLHFSDIPG